MMELALWIILWPLACTVDTYVAAKRKQITGEKQYSQDEYFRISVIAMIVWIVGIVGFAIYISQ